MALLAASLLHVVGTTDSPTLILPEARIETAVKHPFSIGRAVLGKNARSSEAALYEMFFSSQAGGTFVDLAARDGLTASSSVAFEQVLNWTGCLLEANPALCATLHRNRPRAQCLCTAVSNDWSSVPYTFDKKEFESAFGDADNSADAMKYLSSRNKRADAKRVHEVPVLVPSAPLGFLLRISGVAHIDLFEADGNQSSALETFDWSIPVRVWALRGSAQPAVADLLTQHGYHRTLWPLHAAGRTDQLWVRNAERDPNETWPPPLRWRPYTHPRGKAPRVGGDTSKLDVEPAPEPGPDGDATEALANRFRASAQMASGDRNVRSDEAKDVKHDAEVLASLFRASAEMTSSARVKPSNEATTDASRASEVEIKTLASRFRASAQMAGGARNARTSEPTVPERDAKEDAEALANRFHASAQMSKGARVKLSKETTTSVSRAGEADGKVQQLAARFRAAADTAGRMRRERGDDSKSQSASVVTKPMPSKGARAKRVEEPQGVEADWEKAARLYDVEHRREGGPNRTWLGQGG